MSGATIGLGRARLCMRVGWLVAIAYLLGGRAMAADANAVFLAAVRDGQVNQVKILLSKGADVNASNGQGRSALITAAFYGNSEIVRLLVAEGADVNAKDKLETTPLLASLQSANVAVVRTLIGGGADVNAKAKGGQPVLKLAQTQGLEEIAKLLQDAGAKGGGKKK